MRARNRVYMTKALVIALLLGGVASHRADGGDGEASGRECVYEIEATSTLKLPNDEGTAYKETTTLIRGTSSRRVERCPWGLHVTYSYLEYHESVKEGDREVPLDRPLPPPMEVWLDSEGNVQQATAIPSGFDAFFLVPEGLPQAGHEGGHPVEHTVHIPAAGLYPDLDVKLLSGIEEVTEESIQVGVVATTDGTSKLGGRQVDVFAVTKGRFVLSTKDSDFTECEIEGESAVSSDNVLLVSCKRHWTMRRK